MEKNCPLNIRKASNGFIVTPQVITVKQYSAVTDTYGSTPLWEAVYDHVDKLNAFLVEHYKD